jgi:hypothetical protein
MCLHPSDVKEFDIALANLRHAYHQMITVGCVHEEGLEEFARGLIGPSIERLERIRAGLASASR